MARPEVHCLTSSRVVDGPIARREHAREPAYLRYHVTSITPYHVSDRWMPSSKYTVYIYIYKVAVATREAHTIEEYVSISLEISVYTLFIYF